MVMHQSLGTDTTADRAQDRVARATLSGQDCHYAMIGNLGTEHHTSQQDRAVALEMPGLKARRFQNLMRIAFERMHEDCSNVEHGGSTGTVVFYDPESFTLEVGSKGDSPAFLALRYKEHTSLVRISSSHTVHPDAEIDSEAPDSIRREGPPHPGEYGRATHSPIEIDKLIEQVVTNEWGYSRWSWSRPKPKDVKVALIVCSDGVRRPDADMGGECDDIFAEFDAPGEPSSGPLAFANAALKESPNAAQALTKYALKEERSQDNLSAMVVKGLERGKGESLGLCLCDGNGANGHIVAQSGVEAFQHTIIAAYGLDIAETGTLWQDRSRNSRPRPGGRA